MFGFPLTFDSFLSFHSVSTLFRVSKLAALRSRIVTGVFGSKSTSSLSVLFDPNCHRYKPLSYPLIRTMYKRDILHNIVW